MLLLVNIFRTKTLVYHFVTENILPEVYGDDLLCALVLIGFLTSYDIWGESHQLKSDGIPY